MTDAPEIEIPSETKLEHEAERILRRMAEQGACLALAPGMDTGVVVRDAGDGPTLRTAVVDRSIAEAMALKGWIEAGPSSRILRYHITASGRATLRKIVARNESQRALGTDDTVSGPGPWSYAQVGNALGEHTPKRSKYSLGETPLVTLARRRDTSGEPFLSDELVAAGERLREDFELTPTAERPGTETLRSLCVTRPSCPKTENTGQGTAPDRLLAALEALGPGLSDVALRCCCYLDGLEQTERHMGWSARSGKVVLRIALQRLKLHYDANTAHWSPLIG